MTSAVPSPPAAPPFDPARIRGDFPILSRTVNGQPLAYLDNAATSQKPQAVLDAVQDYYRLHNANVHRAVHTLSEEATEAFERARARVARFIGAPAAHNVIFTRGTTDAVNIVARGWARRHLRAGDEILLTQMEHHSNIVPWQLAASDTGAVLRYVPILDDGTLDLEAAAGMVSGKTRLMAVTHVSNVLGTINPAARLAALAHEAGAVFLLDAAQSAARIPLDVAALDCDFLAFSGHKMLAPTGIGVLYGKPERLEEIEPPAGGGGAIREVREQDTTWADLPARLEPGTPHMAGAVGLAAAVDYLENLGVAAVGRHEAVLTAQALELLGAVPGLTLYGPRTGRSGVISFNLGDIHPHDVAQVLDEQGIAVRGGHHCCQPLMRRLGVGAVTRMSLGPYNDHTEVERLVAGLAHVREVLGHGGR